MSHISPRVVHAVAIAVFAVGAASGCSHLKLGLVDASVRKPSNVAVYFTVETNQGAPVPNLLPPNFRIYEDGRPVSLLESRLTILQPEVAAIHYTLLLIDMSGSVVGSGDVPTLVTAASSFADRVGPYQKVAVYLFDGRPHIDQVVPFGGNVRGGISSLLNYRSKDPSTNLNGAVIEGVRALQKQMDASPVPLRFGTLVVFTDGTDRAARAKPEDAQTALDEAGFDSYVIAVGAETDEKELKAIGRSGAFTSRNPTDIAAGFDNIARAIEGYSKRYYLLTYCTPARAGEHDLEIEAVSGDMTGRLSHHFKADGFGPNCDPYQKPAFDVRRPRQQAPGAAQASR